MRADCPRPVVKGRGASKVHPSKDVGRRRAWRAAIVGVAPAPAGKGDRAAARAGSPALLIEHLDRERIGERAGRVARARVRVRLYEMYVRIDEARKQQRPVAVDKTGEGKEREPVSVVCLRVHWCEEPRVSGRLGKGRRSSPSGEASAGAARHIDCFDAAAATVNHIAADQSLLISLEAC